MLGNQLRLEHLKSLSLQEHSLFLLVLPSLVQETHLHVLYLTMGVDVRVDFLVQTLAWMSLLSLFVEQLFVELHFLQLHFLLPLQKVLHLALLVAVDNWVEGEFFFLLLFFLLLLKELVL